MHKLRTKITPILLMYFRAVSLYNKNVVYDLLEHKFRH